MEKLEKGTFYRSYYEAGKYMPDEAKLEYYEKLFSYIFYWIETESEWIVEAVFQAVKPNIKCSRERAIVWAVWGSVSKNAWNKHASKIKAKSKQNQSNVKEEVKEKDNVKEEVKEKITTDFFKQENKELCWYIYSIWNLEKREVVDEVEKMRLWMIDKDKVPKNWKLFTINWFKRIQKRPKPLEMTEVVETLETHWPSMEELEWKSDNFSNILNQF